MILISVSVSVFVSLAACMLFVYFWRRRFRRELETETIIKKLRAEINEMLTELNGTTERNIALLENQIHLVGGILEDAVKTTGVLKREKEKHDLAGKVYSSLGRSRPLSINVEEDGAKPEQTESFPQMSDDSESGEVKPEELQTEPPLMEFESLSTREKALFLYRKGEGFDAIASQLDMSRGEIELIISLHERRH